MHAKTLSLIKSAWHHKVFCKPYPDFLNLAGSLEIDYFFSMEMSDMKSWTTACPGSIPRVTEMRELGCVLVLFCVSFL